MVIKDILNKVLFLPFEFCNVFLTELKNEPFTTEGLDSTNNN